MWMNGPLPPNTWGWGGVVPVGTTTGFYFADFCGDHVKISPDTKDERFLQAHEVAFYNNSLELPPSGAGRCGE